MQIESFSIEQLAELRNRVNTLLAERVSDRQRELSSEAERLGALIAHQQKQKPPKAALTKPKYQKGENAWSGRGTQPAWVKRHLALGGTLDELVA
ncbi:DNA-binding protein H-NS [Bradyrhizobium sp. S3.12.5]|uniref:H-NS family nucleoid-associated regulatory protein n=1 Tax=Bradyrhizobium sp. S3.12.5 TaxID=3156386 RepID=UPI00339B2810